VLRTIRDYAQAGSTARQPRRRYRREGWQEHDEG
jgi:hypothetical protein